jgi:membrane-associated phospholipid phosphatase
VGVALAVWVIVVWITVVYLGEHYVADVAGGICYAAVALAIVAVVSQIRNRQTDRLGTTQTALAD